MKGRIILILLSGVLSAFPVCLKGQEQKKPSRQSSMEAFSKGEYDKAYNEFRQLLASYPKDPLYKYYSAICLVKNGRNPQEAQALLSQAMEGASVKSLPADALFYLGRARQMSGNFAGAEQAYGQFAEKSGKKTAKEYNVAGYISECRAGTGKISEGKEKAALEEIAEKKTPQPPVTSQLPVADMNVPAGMDAGLGKVLEEQYKKDSVDNSSVPGIKQVKTVTSEIKPAAQMPDSLKSIKLTVKQDIKKDTLEKKKVTGNQTVAIKNENEIKQLSKLTTGITSAFDILQKPVTDPKVKIEINPEPPEGLVYRIQTAVFRNPVNPSYFKGITPVFGFRNGSTGITTYYAGMFRKAADASKALERVRSKGFKDSFVVPMTGSKAVSSDRAAVLEKEWGDKPLFSSRPGQDTASDTIPPTLVFRVEIDRSPMPFRDDVLQNMRKLTGSRGLDIETKADGSSTYTTGSFITFESAEEYADLLVRNGFRDAKVIARLGTKEIDVETAKQLFENLK